MSRDIFHAWEKNKHRKEVKLTVADIAEMTKQAVESDLLAKDCDD